MTSRRSIAGGAAREPRGEPGAGRVMGIFVASERGAPMQSLAAAELVAGVGIEGDRYATKRGHWSDPRWPDQELTLAETEVAEAVGLEPGALRRNLATRGVRLETLIDRTFRIGGARLRGVRPCDPCAYLEGLTRPGLLHELAGRGGLRAAIVEGGRIGVGDVIEVEGEG
jgi:MOSC domain-containing protein YiiM